MWVVVYVVKGRSVFPVLLGGDFMQFFRLDPLSPGALRTVSQSIDFYDYSSLV